ncbi:MAG: hypothetical protein R3Y19_04530, partial [Rikenellaceae bacterium]
RSYSYERLRISHSFSNRTYTNKTTISYQNMNLGNGWGISGELIYRGGASLSIEGVWAQGYGGSMTINKQLGDRHDMALTMLYSPLERANNSAATDEAYQLTGNNLYNSNWGWQNGEQRAVRVSTTNQPVAFLTHNFQISRLSNLYSSVYASYGINSYSTFNWQGAPNPNPNYYRYLPSFEESEEAREKLTQMWAHDQSVSQVDFESLYLYNITTSADSHYIIEEQIREPLMGGLQTTYSMESGDGRLLFSTGAEAYFTKEYRYKRIKDLLGGDYWIDIDYFVESDDDYAQMTQNNMAEPNRRVGVGDIFGYNYSLQSMDLSAWSSLNYRVSDSFYLSGALSGGYGTLSREGYWEKEMFLGSQSLGRSAVMQSWEYMSKLGVEYRLGGRLSVGLMGMISSTAPLGENSMIDVDYRNSFIDNPTNEICTSVQLNFNYVTDALRVSSSLYYTQENNATDITHFYSDLYYRYTDMVIRGIDRRYMGFELSAEVALGDSFWLCGAIALSDSRFTSDPEATSYYNTTGELLGVTTLQYRDRYCSSSAQNVGSLSLSYKPYGWSVSLSLNGYGSGYEVISAARYMPEAIALASDPISFVTQEKLPSGMTLDIFGGRTFRLHNGSRLNLYAGINNLTNSRGIKSAGYQSSRLVRENYLYTPRDSNYYYALGINGFVSISFIL